VALISYRAHERQRIAVAAGMNSPVWRVHDTTARVVVFGLRDRRVTPTMSAPFNLKRRSRHRWETKR
jgi:hypothetical protein